MQPFVFHCPTKITFGDDTASGIAEILDEFGASRPLVVTDANLLNAGVLKPVLEGLSQAGLGKPPIFDEVPADSDVNCVRKAAERARSNKCDSVIAVGGGSVIDTAKVANIGLSLAGDVFDYEGMNSLPGRLKPMIVAPTTAGTGSEVSPVAVIKNHDEGVKHLFGSRFLYPDAAVLDPNLILSLPAKLTAATGIDALTHAIESYTATASNAPSDGLCLEAMRLIFAYLPRATADGADLEARSATLVASTMAGIAFSNAGVGIVHALAHSVGAKFGTHHGMTNTVFLPYGMKFNIDCVEKKFADAYKYLSVFLSGEEPPVGLWFSKQATDANTDARLLVSAVNGLVGACKLPTRLRDLGVPGLSEEDLQQITEMSLTDPAIMFNPKPAADSDLMAIIKGAY